jgi:hypothetical protein
MGTEGQCDPIQVAGRNILILRSLRNQAGNAPADPFSYPLSICRSIDPILKYNSISCKQKQYPGIHRQFGSEPESAVIHPVALGKAFG